MTTTSFHSAVILGECDSIFVRALSLEWVRRGIHVTVVTRNHKAEPFDSRVPIVCCHDYRSTALKLFRCVNPLLRWVERSWPKWFLRRYQSATGKQAPEPWEHFWVDAFWDSFSCSAAVRAIGPDLVFGQEAAAYGYATAKCDGIPRILFPWGADIFYSAETSPFIKHLVKKAVRKCDLVVPTSTRAAKYLVDHLGAIPNRVKAVSWGVDLKMFGRATAVTRQALLSELSFPDDAVVIMNCRRFLPLWGAFEALDAFIDVGLKCPKAHFVLLGGAGTEKFVAEARKRLRSARLLDRFQLIDGNIPLQHCSQLFSIADISVSLLGRGDMRSSSVLQAAAAGGVPVLAESAEYRAMEEGGFSAFFVDRSSSEQLQRMLEDLIEQPGLRIQARQTNRKYLQSHEDSITQMDRLIHLISETEVSERH